MKSEVSECCPNETRVVTLEVDDRGEIVRGPDGAPKRFVEEEGGGDAGPDAASNMAEVVVNCRTTPTNTSGRKSCGDTEVHQLPADYVFAQNEAETIWHSDIGSSNWVRIEWEDLAEIVPGSGYRLPRRMKVVAHARSGHGYGERGHTHATVRCRFFRRMS